MEIREMAGATGASAQAVQYSQAVSSSANDPGAGEPAEQQSAPVKDIVTLSVKQGQAGNPSAKAPTDNEQVEEPEQAKSSGVADKVANGNTVVNYSTDDGGALVMKVVNQDSKEVVREIPPQEQRKMRQMIDKYMAQTATAAQPAAAAGSTSG